MANVSITYLGSSIFENSAFWLMERAVLTLPGAQGPCTPRQHKTNFIKTIFWEFMFGENKIWKKLKKYNLKNEK